MKTLATTDLKNVGSSEKIAVITLMLCEEAAY
jgi:hypothetical protein